MQAAAAGGVKFLGGIVKFIVKSFFLFLIPSVAMAGSWQEVGKVTRVHTGHGSGQMYFSTEIQISVATCTNNSNGYTYADNATNSERIYSMLLSAYISKTPVSIYLNDGCLASRPSVSAVQLKDSGITH